jgi:hypothetical protein
VTRLPRGARCATHMTASASCERDNGRGGHLAWPRGRSVTVLTVIQLNGGAFPALEFVSSPGFEPERFALCARLTKACLVRLLRCLSGELDLHFEAPIRPGVCFG